MPKVTMTDDVIIKGFSNLTVDISPDFLAKIFLNMNDEEQGNFFKELTKLPESLFENQMYYARKNVDERTLEYLKIMAGVD